MEDIFKRLFSGKPAKEENGVCYFGNENDGDRFDDCDFYIWTNGGFTRSLRNRKLLENPASRFLAEGIIGGRDYAIDWACGPGMGFIPTLKRLNPRFPCLASDANPYVLSAWKQYLDSAEALEKLSFAQFSMFDLPFENNSVGAYSSFIGVSSSRRGEDGFVSALSEIRRTLDADGAFYTVENEWADVGKVLELFDKTGRQWDAIPEKQTSWHDRFLDCGFEIAYEAPFEYRALNADDNDLSMAAVEYGIEIGMKYTAFIVKKR